MASPKGNKQPSEDVLSPQEQSPYHDQRRLFMGDSPPSESPLLGPTIGAAEDIPPLQQPELEREDRAGTNSRKPPLPRRQGSNRQMNPSSGGGAPQVTMPSSHRRHRTRSIDLTVLSALTEDAALEELADEVTTDANEINQTRARFMSDMSKSILTLEHVAGPIEAEAETAILKALEKQEHILSQEPPFEMDMMPEVPSTNLAHQFEAQPAVTAPPAAAPSRAAPPSPMAKMERRPSLPMSPNLSDMNEQLRLLHAKSPPSDNGSPGTGAHPALARDGGGGGWKRVRKLVDAGDLPKTDTEKLYHHVNLLFHEQPPKQPKQTAAEESEQQVVGSPSTSASSSGWNRLKLTVRGAPLPVRKATAASQESLDGSRISKVSSRVGPQAEMTPPSSAHLEAMENGDQQPAQDPPPPVKESDGEKDSERSQPNRPFSIMTRPKSRFFQAIDQSADVLREVFLPKIPHIMQFAKNVGIKLFVPLLGVAALLFYYLDNPHIGNSDASLSWWLIFVVRQIITLSLSKVAEYFVIDLLALRTKIMLRLAGPHITLLLVQARGWPFTGLFWALWDFAMLYGSGAFASHWLYYQDAIDMFNEKNDAGDIVSSDIYMQVLISLLVVAAAAACKRTLVAVYLGQRSIDTYGARLESNVRRMLLMSELAHLAEGIAEVHAQMRGQETMGESLEMQARPVTAFDYNVLTSNMSEATFSGDEDDVEDVSFGGDVLEQDKDIPISFEDAVDASSPDADAPADKTQQAFETPKPNRRAPVVNSLFRTMKKMNKPRTSKKQKQRDVYDSVYEDHNSVLNLLDEWEEPEIDDRSKQASIQDILQFRQALSYMRQSYPFSMAFGRANTRVNCIISAQRVYLNLLKLTPGRETLPFSTVALIARDRNGMPKREKLLALKRMFPPNKESSLTALEFVRSCDKVYKKLHLFRAATANAMQIDRVFEKIVNAVFYILMGFIVLMILEFDPWALFASVSALVLAFAFSFGPAASKAFDGILLIVIRRPYDIGDKIYVCGPNEASDKGGSSAWFVEKVDLFTTTVRFGSTNEIATIANGSLANSRIINQARSPNPVIFIAMKFAVDVPYTRVKLFKSAVEGFVEARPRQWSKFIGFRATRVESDLGFIEYVILVQHVERWQSTGVILESKAELSSFCLELSKKLGMRYSAPPLPVHLGMTDFAAFTKASAGGEPDAGHNPPPGHNSSISRDFNLQQVMELFSPEDKKSK